MEDHYDINDDIVKVLFTKEQISARAAELGAQISRDYQGKTLLIVCILKGAAFWMAELAQHITIPCEFDFMAVSSYGSGAKSSGVVRFIKDLSVDIEGRDVLVVEDILDSGVTLNYLLKNLKSRNPASLEVAILLRKEGVQKKNLTCKYEGFSAPDDFLVGFGLDYAERYRHLPFIGVLDPKVYESKSD
jgi:hypoxanthine phosphoribosyltransferase